MYELKLYTPDPPGPWIQCCIINMLILFNAKFNTVEKFTFTCIYVHLDLYMRMRSSVLWAHVHILADHVTLSIS